MNWVCLPLFVTSVENTSLECLETNQHDKLCAASDIKNSFFFLLKIISKHYSRTDESIFHVSFKFSLSFDLRVLEICLFHVVTDVKTARRRCYCTKMKDSQCCFFSILVKPIVLCRSLNKEPTQREGWPEINTTEIHANDLRFFVACLS